MVTRYKCHHIPFSLQWIFSGGLDIEFEERKTPEVERLPIAMKSTVKWVLEEAGRYRRRGISREGEKEKKKMGHQRESREERRKNGGLFWFWIIFFGRRNNLLEVKQYCLRRELSRHDHCWLQILILFYCFALFSIDFLDFNLLIGMDFKVQMVVFLSLILFSYLLYFGSFTLSLTFLDDNRCMGCFRA